MKGLWAQGPYKFLLQPKRIAFSNPHPTLGPQPPTQLPNLMAPSAASRLRGVIPLYAGILYCRLLQLRVPSFSMPASCELTGCQSAACSLQVRRCRAHLQTPLEDNALSDPLRFHTDAPRDPTNRIKSLQNDTQSLPKPIVWCTLQLC